MPLSQRLAAEQPRLGNRGCRTCQWFETLPGEDRKSIMDWVENQWSLAQLYKICNTDPDNPLQVSFTALRNHFRDCIK